MGTGTAITTYDLLTDETKQPPRVLTVIVVNELNEMLDKVVRKLRIQHPTLPSAHLRRHYYIESDIDWRHADSRDNANRCECHHDEANRTKHDSTSKRASLAKIDEFACIRRPHGRRHCPPRTLWWSVDNPPNVKKLWPGFTARAVCASADLTFIPPTIESKGASIWLVSFPALKPFAPLPPTSNATYADNTEDFQQLQS